MPVAVTVDREQRNPLPAPWVYRSLSITLSVFRIIIQVAIPNFAGYIRSTPAPWVIFLPNGFRICSFLLSLSQCAAQNL